MPLYRIHITSNDGAIDNLDEEGVELTGVGEARALVVETLLKAAQERIPAGQTRIVMVRAYNEVGQAIYGDEVVLNGPAISAETRDLWRAMAAMNA
ncbi:DUF6894 family protein [Methylobacterium brachythecii]|uniref:DUF6894 domain-containing protein n=1 Tax=Methylobacterium brachythecii TaxID=1176177 RepID=A0A7W6F8S3_9HYPH|nr:hypothetical protein [Methylobacterium brachythecii]MBB3904758.1 hypothetical protein [Methylobacterium brachythecii]GLS45566.1 hypothetical protein GCM10007884_35570 [Methylobacterium brachythecii]